MDLVTPILLSFIAGSATGIGGLLVLIFGKINEKIIGFLMGIAGGVMLVVSFLELFIQALESIDTFTVTITFTIGAIVMMIIDLTIPHIEFGKWETGLIDKKLFNSGLIIAIGMSLHNLPEGIVVSAGFSHLPRLGILVAIMICLHNIPEGIATVTPLIQAGVSKINAIGLALISGMMEPVGALIGIIIMSYMGGTPNFVGYGLGFASGVMTYVTIDELIPIAHEYCTIENKHLVSTGLLTGMILAQLLSLYLHI